MNRSVFCLFTLFLVGLVSHPLQAQKARDWEYGGLLGVNAYHGDVIPFQTFSFREAQPAFGLYARNYRKDHWSIYLAYQQGTLSGGDKTLDVRTERLASFSTAIQELAFRFEIEPVRERSAKNKRLTPFLFAGTGLTFYQPKTDYGLYETAEIAQTWVAEDAKQLQNQLTFSIPVGGGLRFEVGKGWNLAIEFGYRFTFSDYLDGISEAGDPATRDAYFSGGLSMGKRISIPRDRDNDGIVNRRDHCPTIAGLAGLQGCPDEDLDGVADQEDMCPTIPGTPGLQGCPDLDQDGITDAEDLCPGQAGVAKFGGCPDTDGDGIADPDDDCPRQAGLAKFNGCVDSDQDGITDRKDRCPKQPGLEAFRGCPDSDGDGIEDRKDKCPTSFGPLANEGCPEIKPEDSVILDLAVQDVNFQTGKASLIESSFSTLDKIVDLLDRYPDYALSIEGHTDSEGDEVINQTLSEERAQACLEYLVLKGIPKSRLKAIGYGETQPIMTNDSSNGRSRNRRVEFDLYLQK